MNKFQNASKVKCIETSYFGEITIDNIYTVWFLDDEPCFTDDLGSEWSLREGTAFYTCFEIIKKRSRFHR